MTDHENKLRQTITRAMREQRINIAQAARKANVPRPTLSRWLGGIRTIQSSTLAQVIDALGITLRTPRDRRKPR